MSSRLVSHRLAFCAVAGLIASLGGGCAPADTSADAAADSAAAAAAQAVDSAKKDAELKVQGALAVFAGELEAGPLDRSKIPTLIHDYLEANPTFYGSTVALIGEDGKATTSPYVYRGHEGIFLEKELVAPEYKIDEQKWLALPRDTKQPTWTEPYFDEGGGNIWMMTRSVPLHRDGKVYAVVTTDLPVAPPAGAKPAP